MLVFLINLLIVLLVGSLLYYLCEAILGLLPVPAPVKQIIQIILLVIFVFWIIGMLIGGIPPLYHSRI